ncbi:hypothetical protein [Bacillus altitudinis]|uniref:hypothetical protein n=1 Tax=Bacillus altitudinis TaxID=293387 RepID=UPI002101D477|nr:hypothetical protein [Bacillus altitudinis]UTV34895.1 hypothetical protein NM966_19615 [Bacillus altitudinis]
MNRVKLYQKCYDRIGMTVIEKKNMKTGILNSFEVIDNPDGSLSVFYIVGFENENSMWLEKHHESNIVLMKGTEL